MITKQWKKVDWYDESCFILHHMKSWVIVPFYENIRHQDVGIRQASKGSVILWVSKETFCLTIHVDVILTHTTYVSPAADHVNGIL